METAATTTKDTPKPSEAEPAQPQGQEPELKEETIEIKSKRRPSRTSVSGKRARLPPAPVVHHELPLPEGAPGTPVSKLYEGKPMPAGQRLEYEQPFAFFPQSSSAHTHARTEHVFVLPPSTD